jgi:hypothetical protein
MFRSIILAAASLLALPSSAAAHSNACAVWYHLGTSTPLATLEVTTTYEGIPGSFPGAGNRVECWPLNNTSVFFTDDDAEYSLHMSVTASLQAIQGPKNFIFCEWLPTTRLPEVEEFDLSVQTATDMEGDPVDPDVTISELDCDWDGVITTTTTTTIPAPVVCGDFNKDGDLQVTDALGIMRTAVGNVSCLACVCDVDGNGVKSVIDALIALKLAVGVTVPTNCAPC